MLSVLVMPAARFATVRSPERESFGWRIAKVAELLGQPLMPWQRQVADVLGEIDGESGLPAFREVVVTVPRQSGKTLLVLAVQLDRALNWGGPQNIAYTAQTGQDSRSKLVRDQVPMLMASPMGAAVKQVLKGSAYTAVEFLNGSRIEALATSQEAGHGKTVSLAVLDELMADSDDRRIQGLLPAMLTVDDAQLLVTSTAGTDKSVPLRAKVDSGRASVADGSTSGLAYFEWSADETEDSDDPATWLACMPALGHIQGLDSVKHSRLSMPDGEFRRAMLNQWTRSAESVFPEGVWEAVQSSTASPGQGLVFAVDVPLNRVSAVIVSADSSGALEVVDQRPGTSWVAGRLSELVRSHGGPVFLDGSGPAAGLVDVLGREGVQVTALKLGEMQAACSQFFDAVADGLVLVRNDGLLDSSVAGVVRRVVGDSWVWGRSKSDVDISPLVAATVAFSGARSGAGVVPIISFA